MAFTPLNALSTFIAVARHRSFAGAARDLGVSTSALSQSVRQLEVRLGITLLTRTSRAVALTDAGQRLLEHSGPAVDQALESLKTVSARPGEITGRVRLTVPTIGRREAFLMGGPILERGRCGESLAQTGQRARRSLGRPSARCSPGGVAERSEFPCTSAAFIRRPRLRTCDPLV